MKLLILGARGMAGHLMAKYLRTQTLHTVYSTSRVRRDPIHLYADMNDWLSVEKLIESVAPDVVINCVGVLNQFAEADPVHAFWTNGILPHRLSELMDRISGKLIHISSDCVFLGTKGFHHEEDEPDGTTVYARSKALGEVKAAPHLTIRTSIIGPEIRSTGIGLMQWFLSRQGDVPGYTRAMWNGVTTLELAKFVQFVLDRDDDLTGLVHLTAPESISKYNLLGVMQQVFHKTDVNVISEPALQIDRTLLHTRADVQYVVPTYIQMLEDLRVWM
ncbi:SDR family oxidoreductase [Paenibacillus sp. N1-5-1-14]|uniref:dTDP-4-dehydrorhamnose reductase family protein n=1 Tax=Paenibacillus radicibacter TaxID=2972488 RepID=UPI0021590792|nr:SDR family oxidoreductase [Paenibacillus radicibacter]MCR8645193.1 SDR family oxidoreductase [Paenibacillus radicibacter]